MQTGLAVIVKSKVIFLEPVWVKFKFQVKSKIRIKVKFKVNVNVRVRVIVNLIANVLIIMKV